VTMTTREFKPKIRKLNGEYYISLKDLQAMIGALLFLEDKTLTQFIQENGDEAGAEFVIAESEGTLSSYRHILNNLIVFESDRRMRNVDNVNDLLSAFPPMEDS
jgi:hypothetical protein